MALYFSNVGVAIPLIIIGSSFLTFFAGTGICFTAITAGLTGSKQESLIHRIGAEGGMALAAIAMWIDFHYWWLTILYGLFTIGSIIFKMKHHTWWIEVGAFVMVFAGLLMHILK